jgi:hypothetical protein
LDIRWFSSRGRPSNSRFAAADGFDAEADDGLFFRRRGGAGLKSDFRGFRARSATSWAGTL